MEKSDWLKVLVIVIALAFIIETFVFGANGAGLLPNLGGSSNITGLTEFNGTITTYSPLLILPSQPSAQLSIQIQNLSGVSDIENDQGQIVVRTQTRDDVLPTAAFLEQNNITPIAVINIALPSMMQIETDTGLVNASTSGDVISFETYPLLQPNTQVGVSMIATEQDGIYEDYAPTSVKLLLDEESLILNSTIDSLQSVVYDYNIPFANRTEISNTTPGYTESNSVIFNPPITNTQIMEQTNLPYITYIDSSSATVLANFTNTSEMTQDFASINTSLIFPDSQLITDSPANISMTPSGIQYTYSVAMPTEFEGQQLPATSDFTIVSGDNLSINSTIPVNTTAIVSNGQIVAIQPD